MTDSDNNDTSSEHNGPDTITSSTSNRHRKRPSIDSQSFAVAGAGVDLYSTMSTARSSLSGTTAALNSENDIHNFNDSESLSSYGASSYDGNSSVGELQNFSSVDYLYNALNNAINNNNSILDRALAVQAQTSGMLKAKSVELKNLEKEVTAKLEELRKSVNGNKGKPDSRETEGSKKSFKEIFQNCQKTLVWCERRLNKLNEKINKEYPIEFNEAKDQVLSRSNFNVIDEEDLQDFHK